MLNSSSFDFRLHFLPRLLTVVYNLRIWRSNFTWRWIVATRKYWMIWGPDFLAVVWFGSSPTPSLPLPRQTGRLRKKRETTCWWEKGRGGDGGGAKSYDGGKAWPSINHLKLSGSSPIAVMKIMRIFRWRNIVHTCCYDVSCLKKPYKIKKRMKYAQNILYHGLFLLGKETV